MLEAGVRGTSLVKKKAIYNNISLKNEIIAINLFIFNRKVMTDSTQLTSDEIQQYREQFKDYPDALKALDLIDDCDGDLEDALILISMEETGTEPDRGLKLDQLAQRCRPIVCADLSRTILEIFNILTGLFGTVGVAVAVLLYILNKYGLENYCGNSE